MTLNIGFDSRGWLLLETSLKRCERDSVHEFRVHAGGRVEETMDMVLGTIRFCGGLSTQGSGPQSPWKAPSLGFETIGFVGDPLASLR